MASVPTLPAVPNAVPSAYSGATACAPASSSSAVASPVVAGGGGRLESHLPPPTASQSGSQVSRGGGGGSTGSSSSSSAAAAAAAAAAGGSGGPMSAAMQAAVRARRATLLENLMYPVNKEGGRNFLDIALAARRQRVALAMTPTERETDKRSKSGRQLSEIEILQEKHEPEFRQVVPAVADAILAVVHQHGQVLPVRTKDDRYVAYETNALPGITLEDYVHRIAEYTYVSPATMVAALILMDRLCFRHDSLLILPINVFKIFFVSVRVASKVVDLRSLNNKNFAQIGGVSNRHLNDLEARYLIDLRFDLFISPSEFGQYAQRLVPHQPSIPRSAVPTARPFRASSIDSGVTPVHQQHQTQ